jgi:hypothetical protein
MIITATANLGTATNVTVTARNNGESASQTFSIVDAVYKTIPITTDYFKLTMTDSPNDTVCGFSNAVLLNPTTIPADCNAIDFTKTTDNTIKYVSADATFANSVFNIHPIQQLNLYGLKFHFDSSGRSGYRTFSGCNFSSLIELNLTNADFGGCVTTDLPSSYTGTIATADSTFSNTNLSGLSTLNLSNTPFAAT